jgi:hypothetical protein
VVLGCDGWDGMGVLVEYGRALLEHGVYQDLESLLVLRSGPWGGPLQGTTGSACD